MTCLMSAQESPESVTNKLSSPARSPIFSKAEKLEGDVFGFLSLRHPFATWEIQTPENRLGGQVIQILKWQDVEKFQVLYSVYDIQDSGGGGVETRMKNLLTTGQFVKIVPKNFVLRSTEWDAQLSSQVLLKLKDGTYALFSDEGGSGAVIEYQRKFGLIITER